MIAGALLDIHDVLKDGGIVKRVRRSRGAFGSLLGVVVLLVVGAQAVPAQQHDASHPDEERMVVFVKTFVAVQEAMEVLHAGIASVHDREARERVREENDRRIAEIKAAHGITEEDYAALMFLVSSDATHRRMFEELLVRIEDDDPGDY